MTILSFAATAANGGFIGDISRNNARPSLIVAVRLAFI